MPENIVYSSLINLLPPQESEKATRILARKITKIANVLAITGAILMIASYGPSILYFIESGGRNVVSAFLAKTAKDGASEPKTAAPATYEPQFDPSLPLGSHLEIPSIGVDTALQEATYDNYEDALRKGVWRVSDFGAPGEAKPTILAAHRYGYLAWSNLYRKQNSFFNLPKLKVGDIVEITWHQRKYVYEVYAEEKGEQISDYSANLILYTCVTLTGEERIFKYARLLEI